MAGGWGGIVAGAMPGQMYKGFQDAQTQELTQERAGLVNQGLQAELKEQEANRPLVEAQRGMKMQDLEDDKHYRALVRDFLPLARQAKASDNPQYVADALNHYFPDGITSYRGRKETDPRTGTSRYIIDDGMGGRQEFGSIDEALEMPFTFTNRKNYEAYMAASRASRAKIAEKRAEYGFELGKKAQDYRYDLGKLGETSRLKREEDAIRAAQDVEKANLTLTNEQKNAMPFLRGLGVSEVDAMMMWQAANKGDSAAFNRSKLQAISQIYANSMSPEAAKSNADAFVKYADEMNMSAPGGGGGAAAGGPSPDTPITSEEELFRYWRGKKSSDPKAPDYVSDNQIRAAAKKAWQAQGKTIQNPTGATGGTAGTAGKAPAGQPSPSAAPTPQGGIVPQQQQQPQRSIQELDQIETTIPSGPGQAQQGGTATQPAPWATSPSVPIQKDQQRRNNTSLGQRAWNAITPNEANAWGIPEMANGEPPTGIAPLNSTLPFGEGTARGMLMANYAPDVWDKMPPDERARYLLGRTRELHQQKEQDTALESMPLIERIRSRSRVAAGGGGAEVKPVVPGNIDFETRPTVRYPGGKVASVESITVGIEDGKAALIPTLSDDGKKLSPQEAIKYYLNKGRHLGIFASEEDANRYAELHHSEMGPKAMREELAKQGGGGLQPGAPQPQAGTPPPQPGEQRQQGALPKTTGAVPEQQSIPITVKPQASRGLPFFSDKANMFLENPGAQAPAAGQPRGRQPQSGMHPSQSGMHPSQSGMHPSQSTNLSQQTQQAQQVQRAPITDQWGDQVIPGEGQPTNWSELPLRDRAETVLRVVRGESSLGRKKDQAILAAFVASGKNPKVASEILRLGVKMGKLPEILVWPGGGGGGIQRPPAQ